MSRLKRAHLRVMSTNETPSGQVRIDRIQKRLEVLGYSAERASKLAGLNPSFIRDIERGKTRAPRSTSVFALAETLEVDPAYLYGEQDVPRTKSPAPAGSNQGLVTLEYDELELLGLYRAAKEAGEAERILMIARTLVQSSASAVDARGRKIG